MPGMSATAARAGPAAELEQQPAVAGGDPPGAEGDVGAGLARRRAGCRRSRRSAAARAGRSAPRVSAPIGWKSSGRKKCSMSASVTLSRSGVSPLVERKLVESSSAVDRQPAEVAGRQDVAGHIPALVVAAVLSWSRLDRDGRQEQHDGGEDDEQLSPTHESPCPTDLVSIPRLAARSTRIRGNKPPARARGGALGSRGGRLGPRWIAIRSFGALLSPQQRMRLMPPAPGRRSVPEPPPREFETRKSEPDFDTCRADLYPASADVNPGR